MQRGLYGTVLRNGTVFPIMYVHFLSVIFKKINFIGHVFSTGMNGGNCTAPAVCSCPPGYQGRHCEGGMSWKDFLSILSLTDVSVKSIPFRFFYRIALIVIEPGEGVEMFRLSNSKTISFYFKNNLDFLRNGYGCLTSQFNDLS